MVAMGYLNGWDEGSQTTLYLRSRYSTRWVNARHDWEKGGEERGGEEREERKVGRREGGRVERRGEGRREGGGDETLKSSVTKGHTCCIKV